MPNIEWNNISDWDSSQDNTGIDHNNDPYTTSDPSKLKQGYQKQWPPLTHGLVGWWPLSGHYKDLSGEDNHGTPKGGPTAGVAGRGGLEATRFDGKDDKVATSQIQHSVAGFSAFAWVKLESIPSDGDYAVRQRVGGDNNWGLTFANSDAVIAQSNSGDYLNVNLDTTNWHHFGFTSDASRNATAYWDGEPVTTFNMESSSGTAPIWIGGGNSSRYLPATIADVRIYNRELSSSEAQTLYKWGSADLAKPPKNGIAHYKLNGDATDAWGSSDGTTNGGLSWTNDAISGQSADFDGSDDEISASDSAALNPSNITVSAWLKIPDGETNVRPLFKNGSNVAGAYNFYVNSSGQLRFQVHNGSYASTTTAQSINHGSWIHATGTYDGSELRLYVNGMLVGEVTGLSGSITDNDGALYIGSEGGGRYISGRMDDVRIYDYTLTPQEIQELYRWGTKGINLNKHTVMQ